MNSTPVILDVDTGIDDAFAILFAARHPSIKLLGNKKPFKPKLAEIIPIMISMILLLSALIVTHFFL